VFFIAQIIRQDINSAILITIGLGLIGMLLIQG
jgi:hypothetical protein